MSDDRGSAEREGGDQPFALGSGGDDDLPAVVAMSARRVPFSPSSRRHGASALSATEDAVEISVETGRPIPIRALAPVLYVGEVPVTEVRADDPTHYRFVAVQGAALDHEATVRLGWSGQPVEATREVASRLGDLLDEGD